MSPGSPLASVSQICQVPDWPILAWVSEAPKIEQVSIRWSGLGESSGPQVYQL